MSEKLVKDLKSTNLQKPYGYIYKTTNLVNGKIYIGQKAKSEFDHSYFGSGIKLKKAIDKYKKEKFSCFTLAWCWTKQELNQREIEFIAYFKSRDPKVGYNMSLGGDGVGVGFKHSPQNRINKSKSLNNSTKFLNEKHLLKLKASQSKQVICLQTLEVFESITYASKQLDLSMSGISKTIYGERDHVQGYKFDFFDPKKVYIKQPFVKEVLKEKPVKKFKKSLGKEIICLQTLDVYNSIKDVCSAMDLDNTGVSRVLNGKMQHTKTYTFEYFNNSKKYTKQPYFKVQRGTKVICLQTLKTYDSALAACKDLGLSSVSHVLRNKLKHDKGYTFEYFDPNKKYLQQPFIKSRNQTSLKTGKSIICLQTLSVYSSVKQAMQELNLTHISDILNKQRLHEKGYSFEYFDETKTYEKYPFVSKQKKGKKDCQKVICLQTLEVFDSAAQAAKMLNLNASKVGAVLKNKIKRTKEFSFNYYNNDQVYIKQPYYNVQKKQNKNINPKQKIICLQTLEVFDSIVQASKILDLGNISAVLLKKRNHDKGYSFEYFDPNKNYTKQPFFTDILNKTNLNPNSFPAFVV